MANSTLAPRRVVNAVGLAVSVCLSACTTLVPPSVKVTKDPSPSRSEPATRAGDSSTGQTAETVYQRRIEDYEWNSASRNSHIKRVQYADALMHLGEPRRAIGELVETELLYPDAYINAIYLGLAYEMVGELKSARYWISQGIERNVDGRGGSEWLHLAMVEARLAIAQDRDWLQTHSVLENNTHRTAEQILGAIKIQFAVRGDFGFLPDAVVCDLYFEAGVCASSLSARQDYFAQSLGISPLRLSEIQQQEKVSARGQARLQVN